MIEFPAQFSHATIGVNVTRGCRSIHLNVPGPGVLRRNTFSHAWIEIRESRPWSSEPATIGATRRRGASYAREGFTDAARRHIVDTLGPVVARYGFDQAWRELHQAKTRDLDIAPAHDQALRDAAWWQLLGELNAMWQAGDLELTVAERRTVVHLGRDRRAVEVVCEACRDGHRVGWMTDDGDLVPEDDLIDPWRRR